MNDVTNQHAHRERVEQIASALANGLIVVDAAGQIVRMDETTRHDINGGLQDLSLPLSRMEQPGVDCFFSTVDVTIHNTRLPASANRRPTHRWP